MRLTKVGRDEVLEGVANLMSHGMTAAGSDGTRTHVADAHLAVNTRCVGTPIGLVEHVELYLVRVGSGLTRLKESQFIDIDAPDFLSILQHGLRVEAIGGGSTCGVGTETFLPEHDEVLALHGTGKTPLAVVAEVVVALIGTGMPKDASWVFEEHVAGKVVIAEETLEAALGIALGVGRAILTQDGIGGVALVHAELNRVVANERYGLIG